MPICAHDMVCGVDRLHHHQQVEGERVCCTVVHAAMQRIEVGNALQIETNDFQDGRILKAGCAFDNARITF